MTYMGIKIVVFDSLPPDGWFIETKKQVVTIINGQVVLVAKDNQR